MEEFKSGKELALIAMNKELKLLSKKADKAKKECDEYMTMGSEAVSIHEEFVRIVNANESGQHVIDKLEALKKRRNKVQRIMKKDLIKLMDKKFNTASVRDTLNSEIQMMKFRLRK